jgi:hypothetical protein
VPFAASLPLFSVELPPHATMPKSRSNAEKRAMSFIFGKGSNYFDFITLLCVLLWLINVKNIHIFGYYENKPYL